MNPHRVIYGFAAGQNYALPVAAITLVMWLVYALNKREPKLPPSDRFTWLTVALMLWICLSSLNGFGPPEEILKGGGDAEKMLLMTLVAYTLCNTRKRFDLLVLVCVLSVAFYGFKGGIFAILSGGSHRVQGPTSSMIGDNNDLGVALAMTIPMLFYLQYRYPQYYLKWPMRAVIGFTTLGALFTYSRGAALALAAMTVMLCLRTRHKVATVVVIVIAAAGMWHYAPDKWFGRMDTIQSYEDDSSANSRIWIWAVSWEVAKHSPLVGGGIRWGWNWPEVNRVIAGSGVAPLVKPRAAHSIWFQQVSDHGFVGLFLLLGFFVIAAADSRWLIWHTRDKPSLAWGNHFGRMLQVSMVGFAVGGTTVSLNTYDGFYAMVMLGCIVRRLVSAELDTQAAGKAASEANAEAAAEDQRAVKTPAMATLPNVVQRRPAAPQTVRGVPW
jgi:probable O-glycosylation ligase (exosortase A-associated)